MVHNSVPAVYSFLEHLSVHLNCHKKPLTVKKRLTPMTVMMRMTVTVSRRDMGSALL